MANLKMEKRASAVEMVAQGEETRRQGKARSEIRCGNDEEGDGSGKSNKGHGQG